MALPNDSVAITPGSGTTIASHLISGKEYQTVIVADADGHLQGGRPTFAVSSQNTANVAAARTTFIDLFNATGSGIKLHVCGIYVIPSLVAVTGVGLTWEIIRTSAVGTGGTTATPQTFDTENGALPGQVTARTKPTGGATQSTDLRNYSLSSEETNTGTIIIASQGGLELIPRALLPSEGGPGIVLRQNQGLRCVQETNSAAGNTGWLITFVVE
jgi:hypothetical protein